MEEIAIISDIHGNLEALKEVLKDIDKRNIKKIICLGDIIAKGSNMQKCLKLVRKRCQIIIKGNCEEYFAKDNVDITKLSKENQIRRKWIREKFTKEELNYLDLLPYCYEIYISGRLVRMFHAHPEKIDMHVGNIDKIENLYQAFLPSQNTISSQKADVVLYGHAHMQYMQKLYNRVLINVGSVGNAIDVFRSSEKDASVKNTINADYLIIKGKLNSKKHAPLSYEFVSIPYDYMKELNDNKDNVNYKDYENEIKYGKYRDMKKVNKTLINRGIDIDKI